MTPTPYTRILTTSNRPVSVHRYAENAFSNDYYKFLLEKKWTVKTTHNGSKWTGPKQYEADGGKLMMLPTVSVPSAWRDGCPAPIRSHPLCAS